MDRQRVFNQRGIASVVLLLLVVVVAIGALYAGYQARRKTVAPSAARTTTLATAPVKYTGQSAANGLPATAASTAPKGSPSNTGAAVNNSTTNTTVTSSGTSTTINQTPTTTQSTSADTAGSSGLEGHISLVRGCTPPRMCLSALLPYQATVTVDTAGGVPVTSFTSDASGTFKVVLSAGTYLLVPSAYDSGRSTAPNQTVVVQSNTYTSVSIAYHEAL